MISFILGVVCDADVLQCKVSIQKLDGLLEQVPAYGNDYEDCRLIVSVANMFILAGSESSRHLLSGYLRNQSPLDINAMEVRGGFSVAFPTENWCKLLFVIPLLFEPGMKMNGVATANQTPIHFVDGFVMRQNSAFDFAYTPQNLVDDLEGLDWSLMRKDPLVLKDEPQFDDLFVATNKYFEGFSLGERMTLYKMFSAQNNVKATRD